jgi:hypothetical protein
MGLEVLGKLERECSNLVGNRTHDLLACSIVPHTIKYELEMKILRNKYILPAMSSVYVLVFLQKEKCVLGIRKAL